MADSTGAQPTHANLPDGEIANGAAQSACSGTPAGATSTGATQTEATPTEVTPTEVTPTTDIHGADKPGSAEIPSSSPAPAPSTVPATETKTKTETETETETSTASPSAQGKAAFRAPGLDGVRALAVLAVLAFHESLPWLHGGFLGVDVFFVLSGYLITGILATKFDRDGGAGLRTFWQRRARRLLPALAVMLITVTAAVAVLEPDQRASLRPALLGAVTYTSNWWQAFTKQSYFNLYGPPPPLQHLWSLAVEEQFYLLWPLVLTVILIALRRPVLRALAAWAGAFLSALLMLSIYVPGSDPSRVYYGTDTHASALMIGSALALTWPLAKVAAAKAKIRTLLDVAGLAGLAVLGWSMWHFSGKNPAVYPFGLVLAALAAGALVLAATAPGRVAAALSWRPLRWLGVRSYGIYLWHWPVIAITTGIAVRAATSLPARAIGALLPIALAAASWRWLEEPILRNGLRYELKRRYELVLRAPTAVWRGIVPGERNAAQGSVGIREPRWPGTPRVPAAITALAAGLAMLVVAGTAAYGIVKPQSGPTLQQQIAQGAQLASQSQWPGGHDTYPWWRRPSGYPLLVTKQGRRPSRPQRIAGRAVMAIGDSVMLASAPELAQAVPGIYINAQVSRAMIAGVALVRQMAAEHRLRHVVIIGLGTNGPVSADQIAQLRAAIGASRWLVLVNTFVPRPWEHEVNSTIGAAAGRYHNVLLVNWHAAIEHHTNLLWSDGIHPQPIGGKLYARVVRVVVLYALRHSPLPPRQPRSSPVYAKLAGR
jgi:peptidoglycan/LPS O-acetylase OafA/YrhL